MTDQEKLQEQWVKGLKWQPQKREPCQSYVAASAAEYIVFLKRGLLDGSEAWTKLNAILKALQDDWVFSC